MKGFQEASEEKRPMNLIDTDILVDFFRKSFLAEEFFGNLKSKGEILTIFAVTRMELIQGCRSKKETKIILDLLNEFNLIHITELISQKSVELMEIYSISYGLSIPDSLIAATAINMNLELYSKNIRHFNMITGLKVLKPY